MLIQADARTLPLRDGCVQCVVTSPPYFGLRNYSVDAQIGLEATPEIYVQALVGVCREVWRVLKDDGVLWLNLGDSYMARQFGWSNANDRAWAAYHRETGDERPQAKRVGHPMEASHAMSRATGIKCKDLIGIPWRVAFALQADGWTLRSDIIWSKTSAMPESVQDRPTRSHEYLFLLAKQEKYYYNAAAIAEPCSDAMRAEVEQGYDGLGLKDYESAGVQNPSTVKARIIANARAKGSVYTAQAYPDRPQSEPRGAASNFGLPLTRNKRSVWTIGPQPFTGWVKTSRQVRVSWHESDGDTTRITSGDCPVHGDQAVQAAKALCGGRGADGLSRIECSDADPARVPSLGSVPIAPRLADYSAAESRDSLGLSHEAPATPRSTRTRKTARALVTSPPCTPSGESPAGTGDTSALPHSSAGDSRTLSSNTPDQDGQVVAALAESLGCTVGTCSCAYYKIITENMSHFATMPEALVEPCILAGSRLGDLILDPFSGSGTVLAVAERTGRRSVGVDLNPAYHQLAKIRTAQRGLRFENAVNE
jgi:DNA modification methylase